MMLRGRLGQGTFTGSRGADGDLRLVSDDAGAFIKFADLYSRMEGGNLDLTLHTGGDASAGSATVTNFALRGEPALQKLVAAAPSRAPGAAVDPNLARFQKMKIDFARSPGELEIKDAVIYNPNMGLTTAGVIDFTHSAIDVSGTFVPAYSVNNLLNNIPLVGVLLGGQNEGVFAISYHVQGPLSGPQLTINPLSAIAPGILRKFLGAVDGTSARGGAAPSETAATPQYQR